MLWSALTRQQHAFKSKFELRNLDLQVLNGATGAPEHLQQPWQLFGTGAARLHGLPPSQLANGPICSKILLPSLQAGERESDASGIYRDIGNPQSAQKPPVCHIDGRGFRPYGHCMIQSLRPLGGLDTIL